ncbi:MAG: sigma 54 modulation/S30EA ribosomal C-terminal domain-containing protein [Dehalococcoidia bacterium]
MRILRTRLTAIDGVSDTVTRQIRKYKTKLDKHGRKSAPGGLSQAVAEQLAQIEFEDPQEPDVQELEYGQLVRTKRHTMNAESVEDATAQMDLLGHNFYVFRNKASGDINVVYRRHDNDYGLIVPED